MEGVESYTHCTILHCMILYYMRPAILPEQGAAVVRHGDSHSAVILCIQRVVSFQRVDLL